MRILSHYFIARYLGLFLTVLVAALLLLTAVELVLQLDAFFADASLSPASPASQAASSAPSSPSATVAGAPEAHEGAILRRLADRLLAYYLPDVLPIVSLIAVFLTFASSGRALETLAVEAGGIRLGRIVAPVLVTAGMLSLASAILHETLILQAERNLQLSGTGAAQPIDFGRKEFWFQKGRTITNIAQADAANRTLIDVEVFERGPKGEVARVIRAARVQIADDGRWFLEDARIWQFDESQPDAPPRVERFDETWLDLDALAGETLLGAEPGFLPFRDLSRYIESPHATFPSRKRQIIQRFHERVSRPWLILIFAWIALPFGLGVDGAGRFVGPALLAVAAVGLFFLLRGTGDALSAQGLLSAGLTVWAPSVLIGGMTGLLLLRRRL